jgi:16S rRNA processing protein RimM
VGVTDRDKAESLVGLPVKIDRIHAVATGEDEYFIADLVGCTLVAGDEELGEITDVHQHGAADVIEVALKDGGSMLFPFLRSLGLSVDTAAKRVYVDADALKNVAVTN